MRKLLLAAPLAALLPAAAAAGPTLALRLGWDASSGDVSRGSSMSEVAKSDVPLQLDAMWRFGPHFSAGGYYAFGIGLLSGDIADRCDALGVSCSVWTMRAGVRGEWAFSEVSERFAPWLGAGTGWEWVHEKVSQGGESAAQTVSGWEVLSLEAGADTKVSPTLWLGPYVIMRVGQYGRLDGYSVVSKAWHQWYGLGVRGKWDF